MYFNVFYKLYFKVISFLLFYGCLSCQSPTNTPTGIYHTITEEDFHDTSEQDAPELEEPKKFYYVYAVIVTNEPVFGMGYDGAKCTWEKSVYTTPITEEDHNPTEDEKYFGLDHFENLVQKQTLDTVDAKYKAELNQWGEDKDQIYLGGAKSRVVYREFFSFESYKDASISRKGIVQEMENKFNTQ